MFKIRRDSEKIFEKVESKKHNANSKISNQI